MSNQAPTKSGKDQLPESVFDQGGRPQEPREGNGADQPNQEQGISQRKRQERGNEGPDQEPGFGQGA